MVDQLGIEPNAVINCVAVALTLPRASHKWWKVRELNPHASDPYLSGALHRPPSLTVNCAVHSTEYSLFDVRFNYRIHVTSQNMVMTEIAFVTANGDKGMFYTLAVNKIYSPFHRIFYTDSASIIVFVDAYNCPFHCNSPSKIKRE